MVFQTAQFDYLLLLNIPVPIQLENGQTINVKTPSIEQYYTIEEYRLLDSFFMTSILDIQLNPENYGFSADSYLDLILGAKMSDEESKVLKLLESITGTEITKSNVTCNGVPLREEDVLEIRFAYLFSTGKLDINGDPIGQGIKEDEDEMSIKLRKSQERIDALRNNKAGEERISFKQMLIIIMYELNKSPEDLMKMNFFGITQLFDVANTASYDKIEKIAAGNGMLSKDSRYKNILSK